MATRAFSAARLLLLGAILGGAVFARWHRIAGQSFWTDEFLSLEVSSGHGYFDEPTGRVLANPAWLISMRTAGGWGEMIRSLRHSTHPPLYFCLLRLWRDVWPADSDASLRSLSAILSMLAILFAFDAARWWHGIDAALWAAAILAFAAPQIAYAQETRGYTMLVAAMMACCAMLARMEFHGFSRRRAAALFLAALAMLLTHYLGAALLLPMMLYAGLRLRGDLRRRIIRTLGLSLIVSLVLWGPMLYEQLHGFSRNISWMIEPTDGRWLRLGQRLATLPLRFFIEPGNRPGPAAFGSAVLLILPALLVRKHPQMWIWCLILWTNVLVIAVGDVARSSQALSIMRYTLPGAAAAAMLAACAGAALPQRFRHMIPAVIVLGCLMSLPLSYDRAGPDWREFARFVDATCKDNSVVVIYREPYADGSTGVWDIGLSHYQCSPKRSILILSEPADPALLASLRRRGPIDIVSISSEPQTILPGCTVLQSELFPYVGCCTRVEFKTDSLSAVPR